MGHSLLGRLQKTKEWKDVIALIAVGGEAPAVAEKVIMASEKAFDEVQNDPTFKKVMAYIVDLAQAGATDDPKAAFEQLGIQITESTGPLEITMAIHSALDQQCHQTNDDSDFGEQAINALTSTLVEHMKDNQLQLFDQGEAKTLSPLAKLGSPSEFGKFGQRFFANLTNNTLQYFLSKDLGTHVGEGKRFATMNQMRQFEDAIQTHCRESSFITKQYCQGWLAKHLKETGGHISADAAGRFGWYGMNKMRSEISGHYDRYNCGP